jgi:hypothetical protein
MSDQRKFLDADHPMFRQAWVRWVTVLVPAAWTALEVWSGNWVWAAVFGATAAYAFWVLIVTGPTPPAG